MTSPNNPPEDGAEGVPPQVPAAPTAAAAPPPPAEPPAAQPGPPPGPPWPPDGYQYPFAPVYRAPRTPWVNPARRGHVVAAAIVGALIFGGGGLAIGHALASHDDHAVRHGVVRIGPDEGIQGGPGLGRGQFPRPPDGSRRQRPNIPAPSAPVPSPTGSSTR
jgi:hypothetical protein